VAKFRFAAVADGNGHPWIYGDEGMMNPVEWHTTSCEC